MCRQSRPDRSLSDGGRRESRADGGRSLLDRILEGLARPRSRHVLFCLADEEPQAVDELAEAVAERECDPSPTAEQIEIVELALYHNELPKLADLRLLEYDPRSETVCFRDSPDELDDFLRLCREFNAVA